MRMGPALLLLLQLGLAHAIYFHIGETERRCFIEEIPDETMVIGESGRPPADVTGKHAHAHLPQCPPSPLTASSPPPPTASAQSLSVPCAPMTGRYCTPLSAPSLVLSAALCPIRGLPGATLPFLPFTTRCGTSCHTLLPAVLTVGLCARNGYRCRLSVLAVVSAMCSLMAVQILTL